MAEGGEEAVGGDHAVVSAAEVRELKKRILPLERVLGKKTVENEILTEAVKLPSTDPGRRKAWPAAATTRLITPGGCL